MKHKLRLILEGGIEFVFQQMELDDSRLIWKHVHHQDKDKLEFAVVGDYASGRLHRLIITYSISAWNELLNRPLPYGAELRYDVPNGAKKITAHEKHFNLSSTRNVALTELLHRVAKAIESLERIEMPPSGFFYVNVPDVPDRQITIPCTY